MSEPEASTAMRNADDPFLARLQEAVGRPGPVNVARDPVNQPMIRHWADIIDDANPCYVDPDAAALSVHGGIVAPPTMLDVWDKAGVQMRRDGASPVGAVIDVLDAAGFTSTLATNSDLEMTRYLRPGEVLESVARLESVSPEKHTAIGRGHFVTWRTDYATVEGEHVGSVLFRMLKFAPGTGRVDGPSAAGAHGAGAAPPPDPDPSRRPRPAINADNQFFWDGARAHELRIQECNACGALHFPPSPRCRDCGSFSMGFRVASGRGTLYAWAVPHHPQVNGFRYPVLTGLVELEEGTRLVANLVAMAREHIRIGMPLELCWLDSHPALEPGAIDSRGPITLPQFRPVRPARCESTRSVTELEVGDELALCPIPVSATLIVGGALMTRDYFDVHHDRDLAQRRGSRDIFMNIHTSLGLSQRYLSDCLGPETVFRDIRVRLGVPNHPGDTMTMSGAITALDRATGEISVSFRGTNETGDHVTGTAALVLPGGSEHDAIRAASAAAHAEREARS